MNKFKIFASVLIIAFLGFWFVLERLDEGYPANYGDTITYTRTSLDENGDVMMDEGTPATDTTDAVAPAPIVYKDKTAVVAEKNITGTNKLIADGGLGKKIGDTYTVDLAQDDYDYTSNGVYSYSIEITNIDKCTDFGGDACLK